MKSEYRVVVHLGKLKSDRSFTKLETTTNEDDLEQLPLKIQEAIEEYEFDYPERSVA
ncbi:MAG TPA: hypothetical protein VFT87_01080 [Candidatus Saccharimonadales bacterium]|nr:hypothetical protein [Candidatus Saccharimonadales bacterium]